MYRMLGFLRGADLGMVFVVEVELMVTFTCGDGGTEFRSGAMMRDGVEEKELGMREKALRMDEGQW